MPFWFTVLGDHEAARPAAVVLRALATREVPHPSGRPWLLGRWPEGMVAIGQAGTVKLAAVGQHRITAEQLAEAAGRVQAVADLDRLATSLAGSFHLVASLDGRVRVQGTVTGVRRVFHARVGGPIVAADRADVLAGLLGTGLDERRLALHLLEPHILYPLAGLPVWRDVELLATDRYLVLDEDGGQRAVRWWTPPEPVVPMAEGAAVLREALSDAVDARVRGRELVSCDLGGVDSTSVCCLAARREASGGRLHRRDPGPDGRRRRLGGPDGGRPGHRRAPCHPRRGDAAGVPGRSGPWATGWTSRAAPPRSANAGSPSPGEPRPGARGCT